MRPQLHRRPVPEIHAGREKRSSIVDVDVATARDHLLHYLPGLLEYRRAGGVPDHSPGSCGTDRRVQQLDLQVLQGRKICLDTTPARFGTPAEGPESGTGCIQKHAIEELIPPWPRSRIPDMHCDPLGEHPTHQGCAVLVKFDRDEADSPVVGDSRQQRRLTTRTRAEV